MSNDTREALAAECKRLAEDFGHKFAVASSLAAALPQYEKQRVEAFEAEAALHASIDALAALDAVATHEQSVRALESLKTAPELLAALTEQPAAPQGIVEALRIQVRQADERGDEALRLAHAWEKVAVASGDWMPDAHGYPRWSASKARTAAPQVQAEPLTDEQRLHLSQAADLLDEYGNECSRGGTDSTAKGCEASAYVLRQILRAAPAAPAQEPQQPAPHVRPLLDIATSLAEHLHQVQDWIEEHLAAAASSPAPAVPDDPEQHPDFYAWTWDVWVSGGRWRSDFGWKRPSGTVPARNIKAVYTRPAPSPAPAVQPTEAVAELVEALCKVEKWLTSCGDVGPYRCPYLGHIRTLIAKHGQPQGGSNG